MSSKSTATLRDSAKPTKASLPARDVQEFRKLLKAALTAKDSQGRVIGSSTWGVYAFHDYDGEPIYVGQTKEGLATRIRRHLKSTPTSGSKNNPEKDAAFREAQSLLDASEYTAYLKAIKASKFHAILNEKIPPLSEEVPLPEAHKFPLISAETRRDRGHPDVRISRRAETISRLAAVAHERGEVRSCTSTRIRWASREKKTTASWTMTRNDPLYRPCWMSMNCRS